jgi:branched-chain amino acid transport system ATP-binding protein
MSDPLLELQGLTAGYEGLAVVRAIDLQVHPGEVVALVGANGAGKTTTLRTISKLLKPISGRVIFDGQDTAHLSPDRLARSGVAQVPDDRGLFPSLTVDEHFRVGYRGERLDRAHAFTYFPELEKLSDRRAGLLSGGEQQMLALARAMARHPRLLLLDELSLGLAPIIVERLLPAVRRFADESGGGVLLVEQHVHLALEIADRGAVMSHGQIVHTDDAKVLRRDEELLTASYLGEMAVTQEASK